MSSISRESNILFTNLLRLLQFENKRVKYKAKFKLVKKL